MLKVEKEGEEQLRTELQKLREQVKLQNQERKFLLKKIHMLKVQIYATQQQRIFSN
jgi:hypothetical protein